MKYYTEYDSTYDKDDDTIYTFDIETSSILFLNEEIISSDKYDDLTDSDKDKCIKIGFMYIWMLGINDNVFYGRTWEALRIFLGKLNKRKKDIFIHNLSFEFQFLSGNFKLVNVFARKERKVIKCDMEEYNITFRCTYYMTNVALSKLTDVYNLPVEKKCGDLDYTLVRNSKTPLTAKELLYCEYDCLVIYYYIKQELSMYKKFNKIPNTLTGRVRKELQARVLKNYNYRSKLQKCINTDPHIYNLLIDCFAGGYTHANWLYVNEVIKNVVSWDFTSSYPFVMLVEKYPSTTFKKCNVRNIKSILYDDFAYIINIEFKNIKSNYFNNIISKSKAYYIENGVYDNGKIVSASLLKIVINEIDLKIIQEFYSFDDYNILEIYYANKSYLPYELLDFILDKYHNKTAYKNVSGKEYLYSIEKSKFNSLYGMCVTNNIKDDIEFNNEGLWTTKKISNFDILDKLSVERKKGFLSFAYGVWVTSYSRYNLLSNVRLLDEYVIYCDTDSMKLTDGYDINVIYNYNKSVNDKIKQVANFYKIDIKRFEPEDCKGIPHKIGLFDNDGEYKYFKTLGAKKYCYIDKATEELHITVAGVPKVGVSALKNDINNFNDNLFFKSSDTGKKQIFYNDEQPTLKVIDYLGNADIIAEKKGICLMPCSYTLSKSLVYAPKLSDISSKRKKYEE
jgi:hypothetical protein|nr:MAG TPA: DNA polymerase B [Caudoviricetes sp.]